MHYRDAVSTISAARLGATPGVTFISPIVSAMLAASLIREDSAKRVRLSGRCTLYAKNNGLLDALEENYSFPQPGGQQGITYTKLAKLATHDEVDSCNRVINDLLFTQLAGFDPSVVNHLAKVVGELHENVAAHARGAGYSAVQVYRDGDRRRIEYAIADAGCGMLPNVQKLHPEITDAARAIQWCLQRGHTTAVPRTDMAQRLPDDSVWNPYPEHVETYSNEDHHIGEGLWRLRELMDGLAGKLWIVSDQGEFLYDGRKESCRDGRIDWKGVAIEFEVTVQPDRKPSAAQRAKVEGLAERLGL